MEVKGNAVWILNVLVDVTCHHGDTEMADQNSGLVDLHSRGAHRALCPRCAKSRLFFTTGNHGSRGPEFCTLQPLLVH